MRHKVEFDIPVYSDAGLTTAITEDMCVNSTTSLPVIESNRGTVYFSTATYTLTGKNENGDTLWTCEFAYPGGVSGGQITSGSWD